MIYFISDTHFGHSKILEYEKTSRPFATVEDMNEKIIQNWNSKVEDKDTVYILGDVFVGDPDAIEEIMPRLKGKKVLIRGNHDTNSKINRMTPYLSGVYDMYNLKYNGKFFVLCHYPIREWQNKDYGAIHLYGHVHSNEHRNGILAEPYSYHVGADTNELKPISIDDIVRKFENCTHKPRRDGNYYFCEDCDKRIRKYVINEKDVWV